MIEKILKCICIVFDLDRAEVTSEISQSDIEEWDSINSVCLILCLEEEFRVSITPEIGKRMTGCREIEKELKKLGVALDG